MLVGWVLVVVSATLGILHMTNTYQLPPLLPKLPALINDAVVTTHMPASSDQVVQFGSAEHSPRENTDLYAVLLIVGGVLAACSRERNEDEYISQIRLDSLLWALYVYCALLALAFILVSGGWFFSVMTYAMFAPLSSSPPSSFSF